MIPIFGPRTKGSLSIGDTLVLINRLGFYCKHCAFE